MTRAGLLLALVGACAVKAPTAPPDAKPYLQRRADHRTELDARGPGGARYRENLEAPAGVERLEYRSGDLTLWGWFGLPADTSSPVPAVVYFHGGFAFGPEDFENCRPFLDEGFAVFTPTLRAENGNPGDFELLYGELDDAIAAVNLIADRDDIDGDHVYAIGHSVGGALSALLTLHPEARLRLAGSVGGIYVPETFVRWTRIPGNAKLVRFDVANRDELELRVLAPHVGQIVRPHVAYIGRQDRPFIPNARRVQDDARAAGVPFEVVMVDGDHETSLRPALELFAKRIRADAGAPP